MRLPVALFACVTGLALPACKGPSQLVVGIATNLKVRGQLSKVSLEAFRNDVGVGQKFWDVSDQTGTDFILPGSFNYYSEKAGTPLVELRLTGYKGDSLAPVVQRVTRVQLVEEEAMFYRMTLVEACTEGSPSSTCGEGLACVEGLCKPIQIDNKTLLAYATGRESTIECDSGSRYIDTGTCSSGTCSLLPIAAPDCPPGQFCQEGTCYKFDPESPRRLEFAEVCSSADGDLCRDSGVVCASAPGSSKSRCRQSCTSAADCTKQLADSSAAGVSAAVADCTPASAGTRVCTFACDPVDPTKSGCVSGTRCQVVNDGQQFIAPDCVAASSTGGTIAVGAACDAQHIDDCVPGATCIRTTGAPNAVCRKTCLVDDPLTCPSAMLCTPIRTTAGFSSPKYGVCN